MIADNYLDFWNILVNEIVGDSFLFIGVGLFTITFICLKFKFGWDITFLLDLLFLSIVFAYDTGSLIIWVFVLLISGLLFYTSMEIKVR